MPTRTCYVQGHGVDGLHMDSAAFEQLLDLSPYINTSAPAVPESFSLERAYMMFRQLGLRHLVVADQHNHVKGIVTRKVHAQELPSKFDRVRGGTQCALSSNGVCAPGLLTFSSGAFCPRKGDP